MQASMVQARRKLAAELIEKGLLKSKGLINGGWVSALSGKEFEVLDPASGFKVQQNLCDMGAEDAEQAVGAAAESFSVWKSKNMQDRARILSNWSKLIAESSRDIAGLMCLESGKPRAESKGEVNYAKSFIDMYAGMGSNGLVLPAQSTSHMLLVTKEPVGVCSLLTPWNFPAAMLARKAAPALMAGCTVVIKPAEDTPLTTLALAALWEKAGGPRGVLNVVPTSRDMVKDVGGVLTTHEDVRKISFTGSTAVGKQLLKQAAGTVKRTSMELGGNAPFVASAHAAIYLVCNDADVSAAVEGAMAAKFRFGGQVCIAPNRFLVQEGVHDEFVDKMVSKIKTLVVGDGLDSRTNLGPLINKGAKDKVASMLSDALDKGAEAIVGGGLDHDMGANFFPPALLTGCNAEMRIVQEEIFGPVVGVMKFSNDDEALATANSTKSGLASYVYTRDYSRALRFGTGLQTGMVGVNDTSISSAVIPFGGVKESGMGREGSILGLEEYLEVKHICLGGI